MQKQPQVVEAFTDLNLKRDFSFNAKSLEKKSNSGIEKALGVIENSNGKINKGTIHIQDEIDEVS